MDENYIKHWVSFGAFRYKLQLKKHNNTELASMMIYVRSGKNIMYK